MDDIRLRLLGLHSNLVGFALLREAVRYREEVGHELALEEVLSYLRSRTDLIVPIHPELKRTKEEQWVIESIRAANYDDSVTEFIERVHSM